MKTYFVTTGILFGLMAVVHVWRAIVEWPPSGVNLGFVLGMTGLIVIPGSLSCWAWWCLRNLSDERTRREDDKTP